MQQPENTANSILNGVERARYQCVAFQFQDIENRNNQRTDTTTNILRTIIYAIYNIKNTIYIEARLIKR